MFTSAIPVFRVEHLGRSLAYYEVQLGFQVASEVPSGQEQVRMIRDHVEIVLQRGQPGEPCCGGWDAYVRVTGIEQLWEELGSGVEIVQELATNENQERHFELRTADGHVLAFGEWEREHGERVQLLEIHPVLPVRDVAAAMRWYKDILEFQGGSENGGPFATLFEDGVQIFFKETTALEQRRPVIDRPDVVLQARKRYASKLFDRIGDGARVLRRLETSPDGRHEFEIADCDGHGLCIREAW